MIFLVFFFLISGRFGLDRASAAALESASRRAAKANEFAKLVNQLQNQIGTEHLKSVDEQSITLEYRGL